MNRAACFVSVGLALLMPIGCASTKYSNPHLTDAGDIKQQFAIDDGYCAQVVVGSVPRPEVRTYTPTQKSYAISGTVQSYNSTTGYTTSSYSGQASATPSPMDSAAAGYAFGANLRAAVDARKARKRVYRGCMATLGWVAGD